MKTKTFLFGLMAVLSLACQSGAKSNAEDMPEGMVANDKVGSGRLYFEETKFDFGDIVEGDKVKHAFKFKNTGTDPVQITAVNVSCGCTVASKPAKPIGVGMEDEIVIEFNSTGKSGQNHKTINVLSNAENNILNLSFTASVKPKSETE
ncbi:DUF1573 domain-containing protein [Marinilongibacter aquaticus]|uniref:DUF1573 domain-containing protein n=1 Tax=Marinilongibacter aquaticus TaxID=2975157 RepID=UPI0021BD63DC|nr:DUF1573 domain-containing protein [Marinilongibacter aquaticus]UBM59902.1 DUF1573 domain-containing protein [Marinilongibacter aquaticus]